MNQSRARRVIKAIAIWLPTLFFALLFFQVGVGKFAAFDAWSERLAGWGYPAGSNVVIGAVELLGAIALLVPRVAGYGAVTLGAVMLGACGTHLLHGEGKSAAFTAVLAVLLFTLAWFRLPHKPSGVAVPQADRV
ncbi:MAG: DoxX family protein [Acidobacteria bacterium]|nr:DoxX family protein [Acidobacteriota bacterium]MCZ6649795.1 DoxX family protein [Acidobacteriota bacterium]MCZ6747214.1 DoxX family protein [Acidobacteriota bacterium]